MAAIFKIRDRVPAFGDAEAQVLASQFSQCMEWETEDSSVICYRITHEAFGEFADFLVKDLKHQDPPLQRAMQNVLAELTTMLGKKKNSGFVDLLVWW